MIVASVSATTFSPDSGVGLGVRIGGGVVTDPFSQQVQACYVVLRLGLGDGQYRQPRTVLRRRRLIAPYWRST